MKDAECPGIDKIKKAIIISLNLVFFGLVVCLVVSPRRSKAQSRPPSPTQSSGENVQQKRGEGLFLQRCSLCHLPWALKPKTQPSVGPSLNGLFKNARADREKILREAILKGTPNMPGSQYSLEPNEIDDLIAYLKTL